MTVEGAIGGLPSDISGTQYAPEQGVLVESKAREGEGSVDDVRTSVAYLRKQLE
jgi:hypothetical protein